MRDHRLVGALGWWESEGIVGLILGLQVVSLSTEWNKLYLLGLNKSVKIV